VRRVFVRISPNLPEKSPNTFSLSRVRFWRKEVKTFGVIFARIFDKSKLEGELVPALLLLVGEDQAFQSLILQSKVGFALFREQPPLPALDVQREARQLNAAEDDPGCST